MHQATQPTNRSIAHTCAATPSPASHAARLVEAFLEYDEFFALSRRQYVPPNFAEIRHVLNIAQVSTCGAVPVLYPASPAVCTVG
jgi:hypothetical protein